MYTLCGLCRGLHPSAVPPACICLPPAQPWWPNPVIYKTMWQHFWVVILAQLSHEVGKWWFLYQKLCGLLVVMELLQGHSPWMVSMWPPLIHHGPLPDGFFFPSGIVFGRACSPLGSWLLPAWLIFPLWVSSWVTPNFWFLHLGYVSQLTHGTFISFLAPSQRWCVFPQDSPQTVILLFQNVRPLNLQVMVAINWWWSASNLFLHLEPSVAYSTPFCVGLDLLGWVLRSQRAELGSLMRLFTSLVTSVSAGGWDGPPLGSPTPHWVIPRTPAA